MTEVANWNSVLGPNGESLGLALWKATITMADTSGSFTPPSRDTMAGTVVAAWIDPVTLTAAATIKGYAAKDGRATPDYFIDYTVPNPAVEASVLSARLTFVGNIQINVASATAADTFTLYVLVSANADTQTDLATAIATALAAGSDIPITLDSEAVVLGAGTAAIGSVDVSDQISNLVPNATQVDQRLTVDDTVGGVQFAALHADTTHVYVTLEDAQVRVTFDNSAPTSSNGHILNPYYAAYWPKARAAAAKFIRTGATSGVIHCSQMKV